MKKSTLSYICALAAIFLWSTVATAFKLALAHYSPIQLLLVAVISSVVILTIVLALQKKLFLTKSQFCANPRYYLFTGILNPFLYYLVLFKGYDLLPAQQALALNYTWALVLPLLAVPLLNQKLYKTDIIAALMAYLGVYVIATEGSITDFQLESSLGVALMLLSTLLWSLYWIVNTKSKGDPVVSLFLSFLVGLPFILTTLLLTDTLPAWDVEALLGGIYVGLFEMGFTFILWLMALKHAQRAADVTTLAFLSPVMSIGFIAWILQEQILLSTYLGLALILSALSLKVIKPKVINAIDKFNRRR
ncbi:MAG: DMT family transporter [Gammaproteobacteria bacterium]|nr:DMT family transporter [Gammaproteobacteria bacterium]